MASLLLLVALAGAAEGPNATGVDVSALPSPPPMLRGTFLAYGSLLREDELLRSIRQLTDATPGRVVASAQVLRIREPLLAELGKRDIPVAAGPRDAWRQVSDGRAQCHLHVTGGLGWALRTRGACGWSPSRRHIQRGWLQVGLGAPVAFLSYVGVVFSLGALGSQTAAVIAGALGMMISAPLLVLGGWSVAVGAASLRYGHQLRRHGR